jgi:two-component system, chemotaxis family, CheB/CheR fusion protein
MKSKTRKKVSRSDTTDKKASESKGEKHSTSSRSMSARRTQEPGDKVQPETRGLKGRSPNHFPVVGIGASAGGLEAYTELLKNLPLDTGMGFVLVQHLDPQHESALADLLSRATSMPVRKVTNNLRVEANHVYVIPPNTNLGIAQGVLKLQPREQSRTPTRSIDSFFESLAQDQRERAIGVILSGTATDGTVGMEAVKAEGGITFAQDDSARYDSMPHSAIAAGCVDFVLKPADIAKEIARIAKHPYVAGQRHESISLEDDPASATAHEGDETPLPAGGTPLTGAKASRAKAEAADAKAGENGFKKISCSSAIIPAWISPSTNPQPSSVASPGAWC